jgi:acetyl-CoA C-acetyltransferase
MPEDPIVISGYARTPMGGFQGTLAPVPATALGAAAVEAAVSRSGVDPSQIERIYMGCVLPAGLGQAPARQAAITAGLPLTVEATTVNKMCGSGMQAAIMAADAIAADETRIVVAGGMESMTNAPFLLPKHRSGARIGHDRVVDSMMLDGLEDAYEPGRPMGAFAEDVARAYQFTRDEQDAYASSSLGRARAAVESGAFAREIVPVEVKTRAGTISITTDELPGIAQPNKITSLKPAFAPGGTITAASSASISDGAAALVMTRLSVATRHGLPVLARIVARAAHAQEPARFATAPVLAMRKVLDRAGWTIDDVDLFEVNEAFAVVPMIAMRDLGIPAVRMNVNGGATALGHPIGASGARIVVTLLSALAAGAGRRGIASVCIGGGEATAIAIELM